MGSGGKRWDARSGDIRWDVGGMICIRQLACDECGHESVNRSKTEIKIEIRNRFYETGLYQSSGVNIGRGEDHAGG